MSTSLRISPSKDSFSLWSNCRKSIPSLCLKIGSLLTLGTQLRTNMVLVCTESWNGLSWWLHTSLQGQGHSQRWEWQQPQDQPRIVDVSSWPRWALMGTYWTARVLLEVLSQLLYRMTTLSLDSFARRGSPLTLDSSTSLLVSLFTLTLIPLDRSTTLLKMLSIKEQMLSS